jgi:hypothetical protein
MGKLAMTDPIVQIRPAEPPPSWNRRVLFFSNIHSIFYGNVEETRQLMDEITGSHSYGGRVIAIIDLLFSQRPNAMVLEVAPEPSLMKYLAQNIGLSMPQHEILERPGYDRIAAAPDPEHAARQHRLFKNCASTPPNGWTASSPTLIWCASPSCWEKKPSALWTAAKTAITSTCCTAIRSKSASPSSRP